ncbi:hypothetical protein C8J57DRAFT_1218727 [Mycena rebaudengoi]|nr:hypothetical protein C8J57DRAFT_1218727 [Mycena rebaudengoi]
MHSSHSRSSRSRSLQKEYIHGNDSVDRTSHHEPQQLGKWIKVALHLESRDKAFIRFLSANGIPAADIVNLSSWGLTTVDRAIADNYGIAMPGAAVIQPGSISSESDVPWSVLCAKYTAKSGVRDSAHASDASTTCADHDSDRTGGRALSYKCDNNLSVTPSSPAVYDARDFKHSPKKPGKGERTTGPIRRTASGSRVARSAHHPYHQEAAPAHVRATDTFLLNFIERIPLDASWYDPLHAAGFTEAKLRCFAKMEKEDTHKFFETQFPKMKPIDRFLLDAAVRKLSFSH